MLFSTQIHKSYINILLLILRIGVGSSMLTHGIPKLEKFFSDEPIKFSDPLGMGITTSLLLAVFAEFFCSILIILGLGTRLAVIPLIITMAVALFIVHISDPFKKQELALLYILIYLVLLVAGSGKYSLDKLFAKKEDKIK